MPWAQIFARPASQPGWSNHAESGWRCGKLADIIVLDRDIFARDTWEIEETGVLLILLGGKPVHSSDISATNKQ